MTEIMDLAATLFTHGYTPLRLEPREKYTKETGWSTHTPTEQSLRRDFARPSNIGVRLGDIHRDGTCLVAVDVDLDDPQLIRCVEKAIGQKVPIKRGKKGATYFFRLDREMRTFRVSLKRNGKSKPAIDVLARGAQTVLPPSIHPDTEQPYKWLSAMTLENTPYNELPVMSPAVLDEIKGYAANEEDKIFQLNDMEWAGVGGGGNTHDVCLAAVSSMVARQWTDIEIQTRIQRAKREACENAGDAYNWPEADKVIQEWIDSSRDKKFDTTAKSRKDEIPPEMIENYVYVVDIDRMYDLKKNVMLKREQFENKHWRDIPKPWATMITCEDLQVCDRLTYSPGQPRFCKEKSFNSDSVLDCLNVWVPNDLDMDDGDGDVSPWLDLVNKVFDNDPEAINHVLSFLAFMLQRPGERINHALVIQGEQGIGKDTIFAAFSNVIGQHNYTSVSLENVESQFNDWLFGNQLIIFQEMLAPGRRGVYNKLKTVITDPVQNLNIKFLPAQKMRNRANFVFLTNYKHALSIDPDDRRMWVWFSKMKPQPEEYYVRLYRWMADKRSASALYHYLLKYDTSKFNPSAPPPMTMGKEKMVRASGSDVEQYLRNAYEGNSWPLASDLVNITHLTLAMRPLVRSSPSMMRDALDMICGGVEDVETRPRIFDSEGRESRIRLIAIRNKKRWKRADGPELLNQYLMPVPPMPGETEGTYRSFGQKSAAGSASSY